MKDDTIALALAALKRARVCIYELLNRTPVRDVDETLCELGSALTALEAEAEAEAVQVEPVAQGCDFIPGLPFLIYKIDEADKHSAWYVILPTTSAPGSGCLIEFNHCADDDVDKARATFVANACNAYAGISKGIAWQNFPSYLIDRCEGDVITEEGLQFALAKMLKDPLYATPQQPGWQQIETAPKNGTGVLVYCPKSLTVPVTGGYWDAECKCWIAGGYMQKALPPTHWMPLPAAPKAAA